MPRANLHPSTISEYEKETGDYDHSWPHRCSICGLPCKSARGVKIHATKMHKQRQQDFKGRLADKAVQIDKLVEQQALRPVVKCEGKSLENVFRFKYLGTVFAADGLQSHDIKQRIAKAMSRCGQLRHIFASPALSLHLKLRLYEAAVCSLLTFGCETWALTDKTMRTLNGANSRMLTHITGKSIRAEARPLTTSLNLVRMIRIRRYRWLGHILRTSPHRLIHQALLCQSLMNAPGNLLMDAPPFSSPQHLREQAMDRATWRSHIAGIP